MKKILPSFVIILAALFSFHILVAHAQVDSSCSASNVDSDACYEQDCTGQSSEDSGSCNSYALSYAENNNLDSDCSSIDTDDESECCDSGSSPMCVAYENYSSGDAAGEAGAGATCPNTSITSDGAYEQQCTGQADEDSASCNAYAICDDGGNSECADIQNDSIYNDCCNGDSNDSAVCVAYNTSSAADANGQTPAQARQAAIAAGAPKVASGSNTKVASGSNTATTNSTGSTVAPTTSNGISSPDGDGLIPCDGNDCTFNSVIQLFNNLTNFFFGTLLLPIFVVMIMYLGFSYLTAGGKPGQHAKLASMAQHLVLGLLLMLCAWLIVHTILSVLGYTDTLGFFGK